MIRGHQRTPRRRVCSRSDPHTATRSQGVTAHTPDEAGRSRIFVQIVLVIIVLAIAPVMRAEFLTALQLSLSARDGEPFFTLTRHLGVIQPSRGRSVTPAHSGRTQPAARPISLPRPLPLPPADTATAILFALSHRSTTRSTATTPAVAIRTVRRAQRGRQGCSLVAHLWFAVASSGRGPAAGVSAAALSMVRRLRAAISLRQCPRR